MSGLGWQERGACAQPWVDARWFTDQPQRAVEVCAGCPVVELCGQWARENGETGAVWGGVWQGGHLRPVPVPQQRPAGEEYPCDGHMGRRAWYMSGRCHGEGCHRAKCAYDAERKRRARAA